MNVVNDISVINENENENNNNHINIDQDEQEKEKQVDDEKDSEKKKKRVRFPNNIIKGYSDPPKKWKPGEYSTTDLLESYCKACEKQKCKPSSKLTQQLKALQDLDGINGEKVNVLNLKNEKFDIRQIEALEEVFKRLSFKTVDLDGSYFEGEDCASTLFEILDYYDTCEKLILANNRTINIFGLQALSRLLRKSVCVENVDMRGHLFPDYYQFSHFARGIRLSTCLRILHLENSNIQGKLLILLLNALKDNHYVKELYLNENKLQPNDGIYIGGFLKENKHLELLDLRSNQLQDLGLSHICSGLSEQADINGLKVLVVLNNNITLNGLSYLSKALIHNQSLTHLNISQNILTNEGTFVLKESLISNKLIDTLILQKTKIGDEGAIALAEYLAETQSLNRLDLRENDIRLGGIMALTSSLKLNRTLTRLDIDKDLKKDSHIKDYMEQAKRLFQEINDYCARNKSYKAEREAEEKSILTNESSNKSDLEINSETVFIDRIDIDFDGEGDEEVDEEEIDQIIDDTEDLKKIYSNNLISPPANSNSTPFFNKQLSVIIEQNVENSEVDAKNLTDYFDEVNDFHVVDTNNTQQEELKNNVIDEESNEVEENSVDNNSHSLMDLSKETSEIELVNGSNTTQIEYYNDLYEIEMTLNSIIEKIQESMENFDVDKSTDTNGLMQNLNSIETQNSIKLLNDDSFDIESSGSNDASFQNQVDIESIVNAKLTINVNTNKDEDSNNNNKKFTSTPIAVCKYNNIINTKYSNVSIDFEESNGKCNLENDESDIEVLSSSIDNNTTLNTKTEPNLIDSQKQSIAIFKLDDEKLETDENQSIKKCNHDALLNSICETDANVFNNKHLNNMQNPINVNNEVLNSSDEDFNAQLLKPFFTSKLTNSQLSEEILNEIGLK